MRSLAGSYLAICLSLMATGAPAAPAPDARAVIESFERNRQDLRDYHFQSRTQVLFAGEVVERPTRKVEKKIAETREHLDALIGEYTEIGVERMQSVFADARVTAGGPGALTLIQARDVIRRGDSLKIMVDAETLVPRRFELLTSLEGEPVQLRTEFSELDGGPSYPARVTVDTEIKEKKLVVITENFDFVRTP